MPPRVCVETLQPLAVVVAAAAVVVAAAVVAAVESNNALLHAAKDSAGSGSPEAKTRSGDWRCCSTAARAAAAPDAGLLAAAE